MITLSTNTCATKLQLVNRLNFVWGIIRISVFLWKYNPLIKVDCTNVATPLILMTWSLEEPGHQQAWYWPNWSGYSVLHKGFVFVMGKADFMTPSTNSNHDIEMITLLRQCNYSHSIHSKHDIEMVTLQHHYINGLVQKRRNSSVL